MNCSAQQLQNVCDNWCVEYILNRVVDHDNEVPLEKRVAILLDVLEIGDKHLKNKLLYNRQRHYNEGQLCKQTFTKIETSLNLTGARKVNGIGILVGLSSDQFVPVTILITIKCDEQDVYHQSFDVVQSNVLDVKEFFFQTVCITSPCKVLVDFQRAEERFVKNETVISFLIMD
jgi:hypothetical protein